MELVGGTDRNHCPPPRVNDEDIRYDLRNLIAAAADPDPVDEDVTLFLGPDRSINI